MNSRFHLGFILFIFALAISVTYSAPILLPRDISSISSASTAALQVGQCTTSVCTAKTPGTATSAKTRTHFSRDDTTGALNSFGHAKRKPVDDSPTTSHRSADKQVLQRRGVFDKIGNAFKGAFNKVKNVAQKAVNGVKNVAQKAVNGVKQVANKAVNGVKNTVKKAVNGVKNVTNKAANGVKNAVKKAVNGVRNATNKAVNGVKKVVNKAVNGVKKVVNTVKQGAKNVINKVKQGVKTAIQKTKQGLVKAGGWIKKNGAQIAKFALKIHSTGAGLASKFAKFIPVPGVNKAVSAALQAASMVTGMASDAIPANMDPKLQKGMKVLNIVQDPLGAAAEKVGGKGGQVLGMLATAVNIL